MDGRASKSCNGFQDLQKEVRAIKGIKNTGSSRNFAAVTVQHIKALPDLMGTEFLLLCLQLPFYLIGRRCSTSHQL